MNLQAHRTAMPTEFRGVIGKYLGRPKKEDGVALGAVDSRKVNNDGGFSGAILGAVRCYS